jgi:hypothetical protein
MAAEFARLDFAPGWQTTNDNLIELVDLFTDHTIDWTPREGEWSPRIILMHIIGARYHGPIESPEDMTHHQGGGVIANCRTREGIKQELRTSWEMVARFLSDQAKLDAVYEVGGDSESGAERPAPPTLGSVERAAAGMDLGYVDEPEQYTGHYIAYHRFAHDLHHRSTLIGYLSQLGVSLDGRRIRPL